MSTPPSRSPNVPLRAGTMVDETRSLTPLLLVGDSASTPLLFPAGVTAAQRSLEPFDEVRILGGERSRIIVSPMIRRFRMETGSSLSLTCLFGPCGMREVRQRDFLLSLLRRKVKGFGVRPARAEMGAIGD